MMQRKKRVYVFSPNYNHFISAAAVLLAAMLALLAWPQPPHGGEGGYDETFLYNAPINTASVNTVTSEGGKAKLAIIIDDFGQGRDGVTEMLAIKQHLTLAVIPFCDFTKKDAEDGYSKGFEIIVHLPMEAVRGKPSWLGPNPILCSQDNDIIKSVTHMSIEDVPHAVGANVHMGSRASADERVMRCILGEVAKARFFFVDSKTGVNSVIRSVASDMNVPCLERNVFLDGQQPKSHIVKQLRLAADIALKQGSAVAIGHVGVEGGRPTAEAIEEMLPEFDSMGVQIVFVSELLGVHRDGPLAVEN